MRNMSRRELLTIAAATGAVAFAAPARADAPEQFAPEEIIDDGQRFFGTVSRGLAQGVQEAGRRWGLPNAYILGQEASGAFVGGLRYGEGKMYTRNAGTQRIFWQGPSIGFDAGADGDRTMMLVYNLPDTRAIFDRFGGLDGSAYFVGGLGFTAVGRQGRRRRSDSHRTGLASRREPQLSQVHPAGDLESVLTAAACFRLRAREADRQPAPWRMLQRGRGRPCLTLR